jgi:hypothetical protein
MGGWQWPPFTITTLIYMGDGLSPGDMLPYESLIAEFDAIEDANRRDADPAATARHLILSISISLPS